MKAKLPGVTSTFAYGTWYTGSRTQAAQVIGNGMVLYSVVGAQEFRLKSILSDAATALDWIFINLPLPPKQSSTKSTLYVN
jgi:hypothetical protein